jgi:Na+/H+-dicarboxylate symporter
MNHDIALMVALGLPIILLVALRINASLVFLSLCLGAVLVQYVGSEADTLVHLATPRAGEVSTSTIQFILLVAPAAITSLVTVFSVHGRLKNFVNFLPAVAAGALFVLLAVPALPPGLEKTLEHQDVWKYLSKSQSLVIAAGAVVSLSFLWTQRTFFQHHDKRRK